MLFYIVFEHIGIILFPFCNLLNTTPGVFVKRNVVLFNKFSAPEPGTLFESMKQCSKLSNGKEALLSAKIWEMFSILLEQTKQSHDWIDAEIGCKAFGCRGIGGV